ncbi:MAG: hypothetical protein DRN71_04945 [Candidatus Nanohalarchaeota archaeon]|nr:MAG: hypothetical protein DRN71_04945 [Candidatus Nanohaloarchaeota archaeon]
MPLSEVTIFPTTKCNLGCKHCGIDRNVKNETMDDGLLERLLNDLCDTDAGIVITGGEPLQERYAYRLIDCLCNSGIGKENYVVIGTNASWAGCYDDAKQMIGQLEDANVSGLGIGTDVFHREFVPLESVANAINACLDSSIDVSVHVSSFNSTVKEDTKAIYRLAELVGKEVATIKYNPFDNSTILELMEPPKRYKIPFLGKLFNRDKTDLKYNRGVDYVLGEPGQNSFLAGSPLDSESIRIHHKHGVFEGNAKRNLKEKDLLLKRRRIAPTKEFLYQLPDGSVCENEGVVVVMPDGSLLPCCNFPMINSYKEINLGKYPETDLESFEESLGLNSLSCIYSGRWKELYEIIESNGLGKDTYLYYSMIGKTGIIEPPCEMCTELHKRYFV